MKSQGIIRPEDIGFYEKAGLLKSIVGTSSDIVVDGIKAALK